MVTTISHQNDELSWKFCILSVWCQNKYFRWVQLGIKDDSCRLVHEKARTYIESYDSRYVKCTDIYGLRFIHPDLPTGIHTELGTQKQSDIVTEEPNHGRVADQDDLIMWLPITTIPNTVSEKEFSMELTIDKGAQKLGCRNLERSCEKKGWIS